jgi:hypothetical protein
MELYFNYLRSCNDVHKLSLPQQSESFNLKTDFDLTGAAWYARPQLFFNCTLGPTGLMASVRSGSQCCTSHKEVSLEYFSTFEPIELSTMIS